MEMTIREAINRLIKYPATDIYLSNGTKICIPDIRYLTPDRITNLDNFFSKIKIIGGKLVFRKIHALIYTNEHTKLAGLNQYVVYESEEDWVTVDIPEREMNAFISENGGIAIQTFLAADYLSGGYHYE